MIGGFFNPIITTGGTAASMDVDFIASTQSTDAGVGITFSNLSDPTPVFNFWEFGDGSFSTASNPFKTYSTSGTFSVKLHAVDNVSGGIETKTDYISVTQFTPNVISGLVGWYDATQGVTTDTGGVSVWSDLSSNSNNLTQSNSSIRPNLNTSPNRITFAINDRLTSSKTLTVGAVFAVLQQNSENYGTLIGFTTKHGIIRDQTLTRFYPTSIIQNPPIRVNGVTQSIVAGTFPNASYGGFSTSRICVSFKGATGSGVLRLGKGDDVGGAAATNDVNEIIIYDRELTNSEMISVENYLIGKWAL
jgi:PKD repeat protein